jgi:hypothetical protein
MMRSAKAKLDRPGLNRRHGDGLKADVSRQIRRGAGLKKAEKGLDIVSYKLYYVN